MQNRFQAITYLKCFAALIVINSHVGALYPPQFSFVSSGGFFANCLFFFISGFCLTNLKLEFAPWYWKRLVRVGVPFLVLTPFLIFSAKPLNCENAYNAVVSTRYHFVLELLILYIFYCFAVKLNNTARYSHAITSVFVVFFWGLYYFLVYDPSKTGLLTALSPNVFAAYFLAMIMGAIVRGETCEHNLNRSLKATIAFAIAVALFFVAYVGVVIAKLPGLWQGLLFPVSLGLLYCLSEFVLSFNTKLPSVYFVEYTADLTLELYVVQLLLVDVLNILVFRRISFTWSLVRLLSPGRYSLCRTRLSQESQCNLLVKTTNKELFSSSDLFLRTRRYVESYDSCFALFI